MGRAIPICRPADETSEELIPFWQLAPAIEFVCLVIIGLAPMLYIINGPPATFDQAVVQITLVSFAVVGAVSMRIVNLRSTKRWKKLLAGRVEEGI